MAIRELKNLSPFEIQKNLEETAYGTCLSRNRKGDPCSVLDAGRANPNFLNTAPRQALSHLILFASEWASGPGGGDFLGFRHEKRDLNRELREYLGPIETPGAEFLDHALRFAEEVLGLDPGDFVYELADASLGDYYPTPPRILPHVEKCVGAYLNNILFPDGEAPEGKFAFFATEGATAAIISLFRSLKANRLLLSGDRVALVTPIFPPYLDIPVLTDYELVRIHMEVDPLYGRHIPDSEIEILKDPAIKVLFMVNPTNPTSTSLSEESLRKIGRLVREERSDLIVVTDAVYAALADGHRDIAAEIPANTIVLFSYSKYFGATGWRLGVVMMQEHNVADMLISRLKKKERTLVDRRYGSVSGDPGSMSFIDRLVSDSRDVALVHTGGLSCPQQALMCLFSLFGLMEENRTYKKQVQALLLRRKLNLYKGLGIDPPEDPHEINYYVLLNIPAIAESLHGKPFARFFRAHRSAEEYLLRLAENRLTLCLPGRGFAAPASCIRVSLANLDDHVYIAVGKNIRDTLEEFYHQWKGSKT